MLAWLPISWARLQQTHHNVVGSCLSRYVTALYWAMMTISTVGYGDYISVTDAEKIFANATMCIGALIFAGITGSLASRMMSRKGAVQAYNTRMDEIRQFMYDKKVPLAITRRVFLYYKALWSEKHVYDETQILTSMPLSISGPVVSHLYTQALESVPLFKRLREVPHGDLILQRLCMEMKHVVALPADVIMHEGHAGRPELYVIEQGEVDVYTLQGAGVAMNGDGAPATPRGKTRLGVRLGRLGENCYFGELSLMRGALSSRFRVRTVIARCTCKLAVLKRHSVDSLRREFSKLDRIMSEVEAGAGADLVGAISAPSPRHTQQPRESLLDSYDHSCDDGHYGEDDHHGGWRQGDSSPRSRELEQKNQVVLPATPAAGVGELQTWLVGELHKMEMRNLKHLHGAKRPPALLNRLSNCGGCTSFP